MKFLDQPPRFLFFTGKGGVGKTSIACATAIQLAESGKRVLLVSTDPASNVGQVFGIAIGNHITTIPAVPRLAALEIDPQAAAKVSIATASLVLCAEYCPKPWFMGLKSNFQAPAPRRSRPSTNLPHC